MRRDWNRRPSRLRPFRDAPTAGLLWILVGIAAANLFAWALIESYARGG